MHALIASGAGPYGDPWHRFGETSSRIAKILADAGLDVVVSHDVDDAMTRLDGVDLLVTNAGDPWRTEAPTSPVPDCLDAAIARGVGILAFHTSVASLRDYPRWAEATGALWLPTVSGHPPRGPMTITGFTTPDGSAVADFEVDDEAYQRLQFVGDHHLVATHTVNGVTTPAVWTRTLGRTLVAVDTLGHDTATFDSEGHRALIRRLAVWAAHA